MNGKSFSFTKLVVSSLVRSEHFYGRVFGMKPVDRVSSDEHAYALEEVMMSLSGLRDAHLLILTEYLRLPAPPGGSAWTGFVVDDLAEALAAIKSEGGEIAVQPHDTPSHGVRAAVAQDPDGHLIELIQILSTDHTSH